MTCSFWTWSQICLFKITIVLVWWSPTVPWRTLACCCPAWSWSPPRSWCRWVRPPLRCWRVPAVCLPPVTSRLPTEIHRFCKCSWASIRTCTCQRTKWELLRWSLPWMQLIITNRTERKPARMIVQTNQHSVRHRYGDVCQRTRGTRYQLNFNALSL